MDVVCCLIIEKKKVLLAQRPYNKSNPGHWEFPGGKVEVGETREQALVRELREELLISIKGEELIFLGTVLNNNLKLHLFSCPLTSTYSPLEHRAIRWCEQTTLNSQPLCPADQIAIQTYKPSIERLLE